MPRAAIVSMGAEAEWAVLPQAPAYAVSRAGMLRTPRYAALPGHQIGRHRYVTLPDGATRLDKLVAEAFVGPEPWPGCPIVHTNGNLLDCRADNLQWDIRAWIDVHGAIAERPVRRPGPGRPAKADPPLRGYTFDAGLHPATDVCPQCAYRLDREPAFFHCAGCGRYFRVRGGRLDLQHFYETVGRAEAPAR